MKYTYDVHMDSANEWKRTDISIYLYVSVSDLLVLFIHSHFKLYK